MALFLITGAAGFIGYHTCKALMAGGHHVIGIDNLNDYYDPALKRARLDRLAQHQLAQYGTFQFLEGDIADQAFMQSLAATRRFDKIVHLAAQAGVRHSLENPHIYAKANLIGFLNILELARQHETAHTLYASTSSVYGGNPATPYRETDGAAHQLSFYAATKRANEAMAHSYAHTHGLPLTGLRFFTVYGPWGRPDMALFKFTKAILTGQSIDVYNHGDHARDFTYVSDIVEGIVRIADILPTYAPAPQINDRLLSAQQSAFGPHAIYNIGNGEPTQLLDFIELIEQKLQKKANMKLLPMQTGDVTTTHCDPSALWKATGFKPQVSITQGINYFIDWYRDYYNI